MTAARAGRWAAWLIAPLIFAAMIAINGLGEPTYVMGDFRAFYCAGAAIADGANPYLEEPLRTCEATAGPPAEPKFLRPVALPAPLPPYALLLFVPFSRVPFPFAALAFALLSIGAMSVAVAALQRVTGASSTVLNLALAAITASVSYYVGQPMPFVFAALAGAALFVRKERWWTAAACLAAASIEPHVALAAVAAAFVAFPRMRVPLVAWGAGLAAACVFAVGWPVSVAYVRDVVPAHALANSYEWQFSLTSILTSAGVDAQAAIRWGEAMFAVMVLAGIAVAQRLRALTSDAAVTIVIPPAFAVFGGVHVHHQQLAIALPAMLYVFVRYERVRVAAAAGVALAMIPWNVMSSSVLSGCAPLLVGSTAALMIGRRAGLVLTLLAAAIALSMLVLALLGLGPAPTHFVAHAYPAGALAELSWGDFSHAALMRPSVMMQWLRIPTMAGLACGLFAIASAAYAGVGEARRVAFGARDVATQPG